ncbi:MAG: FAD-binding oxidoreductase [Porticoccaceae bacterium]
MSAYYTPNSEYPASYYAASRRHEVVCPALPEDLMVDVCIVGGGYTGLSCALHLAQSGCSVALLEAHRIGWGASGRNGGHVGVGQRRSQQDLEKLVGRDCSGRLWSAGLEAVGLVAELVERHSISCDLQKGILHVAHRHRHLHHYREEAAFLRNRYGYQGAHVLDRSEVMDRLSSTVFHGGLYDQHSMHLHPLNFALGLANAAQKAGALLVENSPVLRYQPSGSNLVVDLADGGRVTARKLVLACNGYLGGLEPRISGFMMPINNFMVATEPLSAELAGMLVKDRLGVQDSRFVINYWRMSDDNRLIFGGGESYRSTLPRNIAPIVKKRIVGIYPQLSDVAIDYAWGGTLSITMDRMPHVGQLNSDVYYAQGYSGHGIPTATYVGKAIAEALAGDSRRFDLFTHLPVRRFPGGTLLRWPAMVAGMLYYSTLDRF